MDGHHPRRAPRDAQSHNVCVTARDVFLDELRQLGKRMGGIRGLFVLVALVMLGTLIPIRAGAGFIDPVYFLAYCCFSLLFASAFVAQSFAGEKEREFLMNRGPEAAAGFQAVLGKVLASAAWGWACWALVFGASLMVLKQAPPVAMTLALGVFVAALSWAASAGGALISINTPSVTMARQMMRLGFFFVLLLAVAGPRMLPREMAESIYRLLDWDMFTRNLLIAAGVLFPLGWLLCLRAAALAAERREGLHIV